jgi:hypothetical protein
MKYAVAAVLAVALSGCVTTRLSSEAQTVFTVVNPEQVKGCQSLGIVKASDRMNGGFIGQGAAEENAERRLRNAAAERGANVILMTRESTGFFGSSQQGEAYRCSRG